MVWRSLRHCVAACEAPWIARSLAAAFCPGSLLPVEELIHAQFSSLRIPPVPAAGCVSQSGSRAARAVTMSTVGRK